MKRDPSAAPRDEPTGTTDAGGGLRASPFMIRRKLALAFGLQLLLVMAVALAGLLGLDRVRASFESAIDRGLRAERLAVRMENALSAARHAEKDFWLRWQAEGFTAAQVHVAENRAHLRRLHQTIAELERHEVGEKVTYPPKQTVEDLVALEPYVNVYAQDFQTAVSLMGEQNALEPLLEQRYRTMVSQILENVRDRTQLQSIAVSLIDLRRGERDFLLRGKRTALAEVRAIGQRLRRQLDDGSRPGRQRTIAALDAYLETFNEAANLDAKIASKVRSFREAAVVVEPLVADIAAAGQRDAAAEVLVAQQASQRTVVLMVTTLVVAMLAGLVLAWRLGLQITAPVTKLARTAQAIGAGDLTARAEVRSRDEMGMLANTFNQMTAQVRSLVLSLEQRVREREQAEEEVRRLNAELEARVQARTHELENANDELEAFSYSVSHDLRTPLRHISSFLYLLGQRRADLDDESRHHLTLIGDAVKRMGRLIDALLDFSRLGRAELRRGGVAVELLVKEARAELQGDLQGRDIEWRLGPLPMVQGDPVLLRQVFVNLLSNAIKFTRSRTPAEIEVRALQGPAAANEVVIVVRDNGVGFDMAYADKLFGVFKRLHRAEDFDGTGIGLANVQRIVRRHGGRVWAEGVLDKGASFYVALPAQRGEVAGGTKPSG